MTKHQTQIRWTHTEGRVGRTWNPVPAYPGYFVSEDGRVLSIKRGKPYLLAPQRAPYEHRYVFVRVDGKQHKLYIHKAVLLAYVGPCPPGMECRHLDGNGANNHRTNLIWGTKLENAADKRRHGTQPRGESSGTATLTEADVEAIKRLRPGVSLRALGRRFGVSHTAIRRAALGIKWAHLEEVREVCNG